MNKIANFLLISAWIIFSRAFDAYCTFLHTPDLKKEANPLVSVLGLSWTPLLIVISILTIYTIYAYYFYTFKEYDLFPKEKGYTFSAFCTYVYLGKKEHWTSMLYKLPTDIQRFNYVLGANLSKSLAVAGIISTLMWILIRNTEFYLKMHSANFIYSLIILSSLGIFLNWYKNLYKEYQA
jgi:hypothetical protein